jgi:molybdopterin-biosynthesis enzyme MoeA-like protein
LVGEELVSIPGSPEEMKAIVKQKVKVTLEEKSTILTASTRSVLLTILVQIADDVQRPDWAARYLQGLRSVKANKRNRSAREHDTDP